MDAVLKIMRASIAIVVALGITAAPSMAGQATFISGYAANTVLTTYRGLAAQQAVPAVATPGANLTLTVQENVDSVSIAFHGLQGRSASSELRGKATASRSASSRAQFSALEDGSKTLGAVQTSAVLTALEFADQHPHASDSVRQNALAGNYIVDVFEPGSRYIFVSMSYPGSADLGKTSIGCNPQRQFRYDTATNTLTEVKNFCS